MADYSVNATQLSGPSGAGAVTVAPVTEPSIVPTVLNALGNAADIFAKGLDLKAKDDAKKRENEIVGQYVKEQTLINDGVAQGMDAGMAASRSRASANKFMAAYPEFYKEFKAAQDALKGTTELGLVEDEEKTARELRKTHIAAAQSAGVEIDMSMPKELIDKKLQSFDIGQRADVEFKRLAERNEEKRKAGRYDAEVAKEEAKTTGIKMINDIATSYMDTTTATVQNIAGEVKAGKISFEDGQLKLNKEFSKISLAIQSAAAANPELAAPYRTLFTDLQKLGNDMIDPKKQVENAQAQIDAIVQKQQLVALSNPKMAVIAAGSKLLGANAQLALAGGNLLTDVVANMIKVPAGTPGTAGFVPQVVGNPNVEKDAIKFIKGSLTKMQEDPEYQKEAANVINHTLIQMGEQFGKQGTTAAQMKDWAALLASPEYGKFATSGLINKQAAQQAEKVFQLQYESTLTKGITQKFNNYLDSQNAGKPGVDPITISEAIDINFSGSGILFAPVPIPVLDPLEQKSQALAVKDLAPAQMAINQLIHMGAHLEGTTDYKKYWEERKHVLLPTIFPDPTLLKVGQEVNGMIYTGGPYARKSSWALKPQ